MTDEEMLAWLLHLVTRDELDRHAQPACFACYPNSWHYKIHGDQADLEASPCTCPCHTIRTRLGVSDALGPSEPT